MNYIDISPLQKAYWFEWKLQPKATAYHNLFIYKLTAAISISRVSQALSTLHHWFPQLSCTFQESIAGIKQCEESNGTHVLLIEVQSYVDLVNYMQQPFNLNGDYLARYVIFQEYDICYLGFCWHHLIIDAQSVTLLLEHLNAWIFPDKTTISLKAIPQINALKLLQQQQSLYQQQYSAASLYWEAKLREVQPCIFQTAADCRFTSSHRIAFSLCEQDTTQVMQHLANITATLFVFLVACIAQLLLQLNKKQQLIFGFTENIRTRETMNQVGNFIAQQLLILHQQDFTKLMSSIREQLHACHQFNHFLLGDIYKLYRKLHPMMTHRLFNISVNYGTYTAMEFNQTPPLLHDNFCSSNDLIIRFEYINTTTKTKRIPHSILFEIDYNENCFSDEAIQDLVKQLIKEIIHVTRNA